MTRVIRIALRQRGEPYLFGAQGPSVFDCSGLVWYAFSQAGEARMMGGRYRNAAGLLRWFHRHHHISHRRGRRGDLVIWGHGSHVGIYLGHGRAISALTSGVRVHRVRAFDEPVTAYLRVLR